MKQLIILFFILQFSLVTQSQSITVSGCPNGDCTLSVEPGTSLNYNATYTLGQNDTFVDINWSCAGATSGCGGNGSATFITWANTPNTNNAHNIKAYLNYRNNGLKQVVSAQRNVTVKHIGAITSMNISGSFSANPANNSTLSIPCGIQSLSISVPTPATDPVIGVTYIWSLPSGWSGSSTSNTINTTTNVGQTNGTISVVARRNDGTFTQSYLVSTTRPVVTTPTLIGVPTASICSGTYFYLTGITTNATSFSWSTTGALSNTFADDDFAEILTTSGGSSGTVTFAVDNACQSPKSVTRTIFVGTPTITSATVDWQPLAYPNYINNPGFLTINVNNSEGSSTTWTLLNGSGNIYYAGQNQASVYAYPFMRVEGVTSNQCGTGEARTFYVQDISNGYYRMASPNPATSIISSEILAMEGLKKVTLVSAARPGIVRMYNANGSLNADTHRNNNLLSFDVGNLPRGLYYLNFFFEGNRNFTEQIELN